MPPVISRWLAGLAVLALAVLIGGGFEMHDEAVEIPASPAARLTAAVPEPGNAIEYVEGYDAGLRRATAENRPLLVLFRAAWCRWCAEFTQGTLVDRRLVGLSRQFVCVIVDADRHATDCQRFGVKEFPTVIVTAAGGGASRRWTGCPSAEELVSAMNETLPIARMAAAEEAAAADATR